MARRRSPPRHFSVASDKPFMTISPSSGPLPPEGATVTATSTHAARRRLDAGQRHHHRAPAAGKVGALGDPPAPINVPVSVSVVAPVTTDPEGSERRIQCVAHPRRGARNGIGSRFVSDVRIDQHRIAVDQLSAHFTPNGTDGTVTGKQITLTVNAGDTKALNDIVKDWYGSGELGEAPQGRWKSVRSTSRARTPSTSTWPPSPPVGRTASHRRAPSGSTSGAAAGELPFES